MDQDEQLVAFIREKVKEHYSETSRPLWLAALGAKVAQAPRDVALPDDVRLSEFIASNLNDELVLIRSKADTKIVAVADIAHSELVDTAMNGETSGVLVGGAPSVPHALRVAFCTSVPAGKRVFFRTAPPFRYIIDDNAPDKSFIEIEAGYRLPETRVTKDVGLPEDVESQLRAKIADWMHDKQLPQDAFAARAKDADRAAETALERLVRAQEPAVRRRLVLPADIAVLLSKS